MYKVFADHKVVQMYRCFLIVCLFVILVLFILSQIWFVVFHMLTTRCCLPVTLTRTLHKLLHVTPDYSYHHPFHCTDHTHKAAGQNTLYKPWTSSFGSQSIVCVYHSHSDNFTEPFCVSKSSLSCFFFTFLLLLCLDSSLVYLVLSDLCLPRSL